MAFLEKISPVWFDKKYLLPAPTHCPDCRMQRRMAFRNEHTLHRRNCDLCKKSMVSSYSPDKPYTVYCTECWWGDAWDPLSFGREIDFSRPFFEQFHELRTAVPRIALHVVNNENSEYVNLSGYNKDCYLIFAAEYDRQCLYGTQVIKCDSCVDTLQCFESTHCYEVTDVEKCNEVFFSKDCSNCSSSAFLSDCKGCRDCFLCTNLRNNQHCVMNKQLSPEEYAKRKAQLLNDLRDGKLPALQKQCDALAAGSIHKHLEILNCENVSGNYLGNSRDLRHCFDLSYGEDCAYVATAFRIKDAMDICHATDVQLVYEGMSVGYGSYNVIVTSGAWGVKDSCYTDISHASAGLFGCIGIRNKQFCILNKKYEKHDYERLVPRIIEHMMTPLRSSDGSFAGQEWGEYFPVTHSPFCYNETVAMDHYPLTEKEIRKRGWQWYGKEEDMPQVTKTIPAQKLPADIAQVPDDVTNWAITCEATGRPFKIVKQELDFYRLHALPVPRLHPDERHRRRMALRRPRTLHERICSKCAKQITSTYAADRKEKVYCEKCYLKEVY
ncbi:MAG: hypothetical protein HOO67_07740 [Candidatus Peribacteraceae bacterium]|nr:hypothetical protein [Candidatus Peribacteraceae bacterium]